MTAVGSIPPATANNLFAAVDMGTNSFKLTVVRVDPNSGRFLTLNRLKEPVLLGLDITNTSGNAPLSTSSFDRAIHAIQRFNDYLRLYSIPPSHLRLVATSAIREASNKSEFAHLVEKTLGVHVDIISGAEEARLIYLGVLQFFPIFTSTVLSIDIGGGSTEFTVGIEGNVLFSKSLRLGHVTLTQQFDDVMEMREYIRDELEISGLIEKVKEFNLDVVVGSSGTIKAIDKAVSNGYGVKLEENACLVDEFVKREWRFTRHELRCLLERLYDEENDTECKVRRVEFFKGRAAFILAGAVLLEEVFDKLGIEEMEVSGHALGEGVITEMLGQVFQGFNLNANARWRSVVRLAARFNNKKRMKMATMCFGIAREIFEGLRKVKMLNDHNEDGDNELLVFLDEMDLEYLDAACLLHNIGMYTGNKGYHKQSYRAIVNGDHLHGYSKEEVKLIALLVRYHRKKRPKSDILQGSAKEVKQKFRILCTIMRTSSALQQCLPINFQVVDFMHSAEGLKLVLCAAADTRNCSSDTGKPSSENVNFLMKKELEYFRMVFKQNLSILVA